MQVLKFGGTSVGTPERMKKVASIVTGQNNKVIVVLSAVSGTTNSLVELNIFASIKQDEFETKVSQLYTSYQSFVESLLSTEEYLIAAKKVVDEHFEVIQSQEISNDQRLAQGELLSTQLFHLYLQEQNINSVWLPALDFMCIDDNQEPTIDLIEKNLKEILSKSDDVGIYVTQGFICKDHLGEVANLQRGGSDYTASLIGAAIQAEEVQIWTDIDGMHNNDPRYTQGTYPIAELNFDEAAELAYFGAKILHPASILPAKKYNIPVRLKSTLDETAEGTLITQKLNDDSIKAIAAKDGITAIKIKSARMLLAYGFLRKVFEVFEQYKTPIDMITTSEVAVSLTTDNSEHLDKIVQDLQHFGTVEVDTDQTIICIVGNLLAEKKGIIKEIFNALADIPVRMVSYGGSRHNVSMLINSEYKIKALNDLNHGLFKQVADKHE